MDEITEHRMENRERNARYGDCGERFRVAARLYVRDWHHLVWPGVSDLRDARARNAGRGGSRSSSGLRNVRDYAESGGERANGGLQRVGRGALKQEKSR